MTPRQENALFFFVAIATVGVYLLRSMKASLKHRLDLLIGNIEAEAARNPGRVYLTILGAVVGLVAAVVLL